MTFLFEIISSLGARKQKGNLGHASVCRTNYVNVLVHGNVYVCAINRKNSGVSVSMIIGMCRCRECDQRCM